MPTTLHSTSPSYGFADTFPQQFDLAADVHTHRSIGDWLRNAKDLSDADVERILDFQAKHGLRFGDAAIALGLARSDEVLWALSQQFHYPYAAKREYLLHDELVVANHPFSEQVEPFRNLRTQLMTDGPMALIEARRVLAVVSSDIGDGKTFVAANLAAAFSQLSGRTLLIDADMRAPRQHHLFGIDVDAGLSGMLAGRTKPNVLRPVVDLPNLHVLPVGAVPPNPLELLQQPAFTLLMGRLANKFDYVIVDTPALAHGADAGVIATCCGSALIVGRKNKSQITGIETLLAQLHKGHTRIAGVLMNDY